MLTCLLKKNIFLILRVGFHALFALLPCIAWSQVENVRIKDITDITGVRSNPLVGVGLVVGLAGTGDSKANMATNKAAMNLLQRQDFGVKLNEVITKNMAIVLVTAELLPFAKIGDKLSIRLSSIGDASSLEGGTLLLTPLSGPDNRIYAIAQGAISQGTAMAGTQGGGRSQSSAPKTVAMSFGATVEREYPTAFIVNNTLTLSLKDPDFTTAMRISNAINENFGEFIADPINSGSVNVKLPKSVTFNNPSFNPVTFVSMLEQLKISPDEKAVVVINERTGTIISGHAVTVSPVAISHGALEIVVGNQKKSNHTLSSETNVKELVEGLNVMGAGPKDVVSILQTLAAAHALRGELKLF